MTWRGRQLISTETHSGANGESTVTLKAHGHKPVCRIVAMLATRSLADLWKRFLAEVSEGQLLEPS